ncbi:MAG: tetratricopeptide repeat protein [Candidatus Kapaibacterium sp.]
MHITKETLKKMSAGCSTAYSVYSDLSIRISKEDSLPFDIEECIRIILELGNAFIEEQFYHEFDELVQEADSMFTAHQIPDGQIGRYLDTIANGFLQRARYNKATEYYQRFLKICKVSTSEYSRTLERLGVIEYNCSKYQEALQTLKTALSNVPADFDPALKASILGNIGNCYWSSSDLNLAEEYYISALQINQSVGNAKGTASNLSNLANINAQQTDYDLAIDYYREAIELNTTLQNQKSIILNYGNLGNVFAIQGLYVEAIDSYSKALDIARTIDNAHDEAWCLGNLGIIYQDIEEYQQAEEYYSMAILKYSLLGNNDGSAVWLLNKGCSQALRGDNKAALQSFADSYDMYSKLGDKQGVGHSLSQRAALYSKAGEWEKAKGDCIIALGIAEEMGDKYSEVICSIAMATIQLHSKDVNLSSVIETLRTSLNTAKTLGLAKEQYEIHKLLSEVLKGSGDYKSAIQHFAEYHDLEKELLRADVQKKAKQLDAERRFAEAERMRVEAVHKHELASRDAEIYRLENVELAAANTTISNQNAELVIKQEIINKKNDELRQAIIDLVTLKASGKARTYFLFFTLGLFIISDVVIDPLIDLITTSLVFASAIRFALVLVLRPIEVFVEEMMVKRKKEEIVKAATG